jgi:hypothetical protein
MASTVRLWRTSSSSLKDDELLLLDPLFDAHVSERALLAHNYASSFNTGYSHALSNQAVTACLATFEEEGLLFLPDPSRPSTYALTPAGGELWEAERAPEWSLYCVASEAPQDDGTCLVDVTAFSRDVGYAYLVAARHCGVYHGFDTDNLSWHQPTPSRIYWKEAPRPWCTTVRLRTNDWSSIDVARFRKEVTSWSDISDLKSISPLSSRSGPP